MSDNKNITILYVDDEEINLFLLKSSFEGKYNVLTAPSGEEGLKTMDQYQDQISVVISDMSMPLMNGVEFISKAREKHHRQSYFILSGYNFNNEIEKAMREKAVQKFFTKPFDTSELEFAVEEACQN